MQNALTTNRKPVYYIDTIGIGAGIINVDFDLNDDYYTDVIKTSDLVDFITHNSVKGRYLLDAGTYLLENIYEVTEAYLIATKARQNSNSVLIAN